MKISPQKSPLKVIDFLSSLCKFKTTFLLAAQGFPSKIPFCLFPLPASIFFKNIIIPIDFIQIVSYNIKKPAVLAGQGVIPSINTLLLSFPKTASIFFLSVF